MTFRDFQRAGDLVNMPLTEPQLGDIVILCDIRFQSVTGLSQAGFDLADEPLETLDMTAGFKHLR